MYTIAQLHWTLYSLTHSENTGFSPLTTQSELQPVQLFLPPRSRDRDQTERLMWHHHFPFPLVISVSLRPAAADCSCHNVVTGARSACEFRGLKVTIWILLRRCTSDTWNNLSRTGSRTSFIPWLLSVLICHPLSPVADALSEAMRTCCVTSIHEQAFHYREHVCVWVKALSISFEVSFSWGVFNERFTHSKVSVLCEHMCAFFFY